MSDAMQIDNPGSVLVLVNPALVPAEVFRAGGVDDVLAKLRAAASTFRGDVSSPRGREAIASFAYKLARSKTALDAMGKDLTEQWRTQTNSVNADRRRIRDEIDALAVEVRRPLTEYEDREKARVANHEAALREIAMLDVTGDVSSSMVERALAELDSRADRVWEEFGIRASEAVAAMGDRLRAALVAAQRREAEAAELARLRAAEEERQRQAAIEAQRHREAELARKAAEAARAEAEQAAERASQAAERRVEEQRLAAERQAAQERQEAAERQAEADRRAKAAEERVRAAELRRQEDARRAEAQRVHDAQEALRARREAVEMEQRRVAEEKAQALQDAARREANRAHKAKVNGRARDGLMVAAPGITEEQAVAIVTAIARGEVPGVSLAY